MNMSYFVLADCNNFYVSCERLLNPSLEGKPVIVLSNNDGCVVARSQEAKKIDIKMGAPFFKIRDLCRSKRVHVFSSNYQLYGDISQRVMDILSSRAPELQIYSIDEAFLKYPSDVGASELFKLCADLKKIIKRWVGIPVSFGFSQTKTLAKIANDCAKENRDVGVFDLSARGIQEEVLKTYPIKGVWGIGHRLSERLNGMGIYTAKDFYTTDPSVIRSRMGVVGERMLWELRGVSCLDLQEVAPKKSIACSRSFGRTVKEASELAEALATFANTACIKLRKQNSCANAVCVYLEAIIEPQFPTRRQYSTTVAFQQPTQDTMQIITAAKKGLKRIFREKEYYKKCGVILLDLQHEKTVIPDLFLGTDPKRKILMDTIDQVNSHFGKNTLFFGAMGVNPTWKVKSQLASLHNTTSWYHLPLVKASCFPQSEIN